MFIAVLILCKNIIDIIAVAAAVVAAAVAAAAIVHIYQRKTTPLYDFHVMDFMVYSNPGILTSALVFVIFTHD